MKKIVEYDSKMNQLNFGKFKEKELDLFFSICYKMKNEGTNEVVLTFQELKELSNYTKNDLVRFTSDLKGVYKKLISITMEQETETEIHGFVLFTDYTIKKNERTVSIRVNDKYKYILNDIGKFTKFDLLEFINLKSSYAKNIFKLLKQFDNIDKHNWYQVKLENFITLMGIPSHYKMGNIDQRVLKPALEQLKPLFLNLEIEKIKKGVKVDSLKFTWKNKKEKKKDDFLDIQPIKRKKATLGEKELQEYEKEQLENITRELEKKKIVKNIPSDPIVELKKISKKDYENLYKDYLERLGEQHNLYMRKSFDFINKTKYEIIEEVEKKKFTENDIDESLLVSKTGKKLVGTARKNKIEKLLEEMNK